MKHLFCFLICFCLTLAHANLYAQARQGTTSSVSSTRRNVTTIVFAGLAGAVVGLSTLSFYGRPQDRLSNIAVGAAVGIIGGTLFTTYKAATEPREFYNLQRQPELWRIAEMSRDWPTLQPTAQWTFSF